MPIIFVPGIKGSKLVNTYPLEWETRFSLEDMVVGDLFEDTLDFRLVEGRYDVGVRHEFQAGESIRYAYAPIVERLRRWVDPATYLFTYDWRLGLEESSRRLAAAIERVRGKARALGLDETVHLVAHSMGALVVSSALNRSSPPFEGIGRVVLLAPPLRGAGDVPEVLVAGEKQGWLGEQEDYRKLARGFPSVYQMVPAFDGAAVTVATGGELDLFNVQNWQENVVASDTFSAELLADAEAFVRGRGKRYGGSSPAPMLSVRQWRRHAEDVLVLMSVGEPTVVQIPVDVQNPRNGNWFRFGEAVRDDLGDGRVHLKSAALPGITLAAYRGAGDHALLVRDGRIAATTSLWLQGKRALKMKPRNQLHSVDRPTRTYFEPWDGDPDHFERHVVE